jgi:hypothetical protein
VSAGQSDAFADRRRALEEEFFRKEEQKLVELLRVKQEKEALRAVLAQSGSKISDALVNSLFEHGVTPKALAALALVPLVIVAWADGSDEQKEKTAIIQAATSIGVPTDGPGYALLQAWLEHKPPTKLLHTWETYTTALVATLTPEQREGMKSDIIGRARAVAQAAGGFLGLGPKVSAAEAQILERLEKAFDGTAQS